MGDRKLSILTSN